MIQKALAVSPTGRYQSAQDLRQALADAAQQARQERINTLYQQAETAAARNDFLIAEDSLRQVLTLDPDHAAALALLNQVVQQRDAGQRYHTLVTAVAQVKAEAVALQQLSPPLADPDGVLRWLSAPPQAALPQATSPQAARSVAAPNPIATPTPVAISPWLQRGALALLVIGLGAAVLGGISATTAMEQVAPSPESNILGVGNFFFGLGAGLVVLALAWLNLPPTHTRPERILISVVIIAATVAAVLGMAAASEAMPQVPESQNTHNLGVGNFALGLGLSLSLGGLLLGWYARRR